MAVVKRYYAEGGDTTKIFKNIVNTNPNLVVVAEVNPPQPGDVEITEGQFNTYQDAIDAATEAHLAAEASTHRTILETNADGARPFLLGIGLSNSQINVMFGLEPTYTP